MNKLSIFDYDGRQIRTVLKDGQPWWVLKDICGVLELTTPARVAERLEIDEVSETHIIDSLGRTQLTTIINESGLYNVIIRSDKPEAKKFRCWITSEVLPSIRKHGVYAVDELLDNPDFLIKALTELKEERAKSAQLSAENTSLKPKAEFFDRTMSSKDLISFDEAAKVLNIPGIGRNNLFKILREKKVIIPYTRIPYQRHIDAGYFEVKNNPWVDKNGEEHIDQRPFFTTKGMEYVYRILAA